MTLKDLLAQTIDRCRIQFIGEAVTRIHAKRTHSLVTFATDSLTPDNLLNPETAPFVGVIIWIPRAEYESLAGKK